MNLKSRIGDLSEKRNPFLFSFFFPSPFFFLSFLLIIYQTRFNEISDSTILFPTRYQSCQEIKFLQSCTINKVYKFSESLFSREWAKRSAKMGEFSFLFVLYSIVSLIGASKFDNCEYINNCNVCTSNGSLVKMKRNVDTINIFELNLTSIDENTFEDVTPIKLSFSIGNNISSVKKESFKGLEMLKELDLSNNMILLSPYLFSELKHLRLLILKNNKFKEIPKHSFAGIPNLKELHLQRNYIQSVNNDSFSGLSSLETLQLDNNRISNIDAESICLMPKLEELHLMNNTLTSIQPGSLTCLHNLKLVNFAFNRLARLSKTDFEGLMNIESMNLRNNRIATIDPDTFSHMEKLKNLFLRNNQLTTIGSRLFNGLTALSSLELNSNKIDTLEPGSFADLNNLHVLHLEDNNLTAMDREKVGLTNSTNLIVHEGNTTTSTFNEEEDQATILYWLIILEKDSILIKIDEKNNRISFN